jgi:methanogenic corrinoid protein MtbC1
MSEAILENLKKAVLSYSAADAEKYAKEAVAAGIDPVQALDALTEAIREIGAGFGKGELFLPELVGGADAMQAATPILEEEVKKTSGKRDTLGTVVIGTVAGDIHSIGIAMVASLMVAEGFEVKNLGVDVSAESFIDAVGREEPKILAMSALMTTTAPEMKKVVDMLVSNGMREKLKLMVGGGAITNDFANTIGADGYAPTAPMGAQLAKVLVGA